MSITINLRPSLGGATLFESATATTIAEAVEEMGAHPNLRGADLRGAYLSGALVSWQSHDLLAELLLRKAGGDLERRKLAGLVLISRDWCWDELLALPIKPTLRDWALGTLAEFAWSEDATVPDALLTWMVAQGIVRPVRPVVAKPAAESEVAA
jgi:uncharacterized protein YjbI with pentapeptide repeats